MTIVITYGTFDLFHIGHLRILQRAKQLGNKLYVGISSDEFNTLKKKQSIFPYTQRAEIVKAIKYVDGVFAEQSWDQKKEDILRLKASLLVMGDDWVGRFDQYNKYCQVKYLPRTKNISTTLIKQKFKKYS
ncbi:adenylyltransferase/cytidyltransferase family protein [Commensalibacter melissae]|uniref:adenylyltransferase/cytidyltransferase family protein n=1 Tax=Commensalibacter melissae TaxID=2070537 RepID=UPI000EFB21CA|nr:adenylyltransferase/cytidyltransferase family protein [Commensalibacter melissae]AYN87267.1 glycerol-3-phosphate cytidylyltransferase [Commensalibacter melissae]